jgi:predicted RNA-binding protein with PUA-like domain
LSPKCRAGEDGICNGGAIERGVPIAGIPAKLPKRPEHAGNQPYAARRHSVRSTIHTTLFVRRFLARSDLTPAGHHCAKEYMKYWLIKTEPESFSIADLAASPRQTTCWDGVRNYQARNTLRDDMQAGDEVLFYHSSAEPPAVVGTCKVVKAGYSDHTAWDAKSHHYDPKASPDNPIWQMVDVQLVEIFPRPVSLAELREVKSLAGMELLRKGSRLSVQPVKAAEFKTVVKLGHERA